MTVVHRSVFCRSSYIFTSPLRRRTRQSIYGTYSLGAHDVANRKEDYWSVWWPIYNTVSSSRRNRSGPAALPDVALPDVALRQIAEIEVRVLVLHERYCFG